MLCLIPALAHLPELLGIVHTTPLVHATSLSLHPFDSLLYGSPYLEGSAATETMSLGRLSAESWLQGHLPWWNPYVGAGLPLASQLQPAAFFLPFVLLLHFAQGMLLLKLSMQILAGLFCYAFLRRIATGSWAAMLAAILFECNGTFAFYADTPILPIAFLPLLLLGIEQARARAVHGGTGGQTMIALAIAYCLVAGFAETAFLDGLLALAWAMLRACSLDRRCAFRFAASVAIGGMIGLALASPALLPFLHDLAISDIGFGRATAAQAAFPLNSAPLLLFPYLYGAPISQMNLLVWTSLGGFIGAVTFMLTLLAWSGRNGPRGARTLLLVWLAIGLATASGIPVAGHLIRHLPVLDLIWISRYGFPSFSFCACVLAAFALDDFAERGRLRAGIPVVVFGATVLAALFVAYRSAGLNEVSFAGAPRIAGLSIGWGIGAPLVLAALLRLPVGAARRGAIAALVIIDAIGLTVIPTLTGTRDPRLFEAPIAFLRSHAGLSRIVSVSNALWFNAGAYLGLGVVNYIYVPVPILWADYVTHNLNPASMRLMYPNLFETVPTNAAVVAGHTPALEQLAVRYVIAPSSLDMFAPGGGAAPAARVFRDGGVDIFELSGARPYAETQGGPCRLDIADREHMRADCDAPAHLLRRELSFPGWHAQVNGRRAGIETVGEIFQRIDLPAGRAVITWRYIPENANTIALVFSAGVLGLIACAWTDARGRGLAKGGLAAAGVPAGAAISAPVVRSSPRALPRHRTPRR